MSWVLRAFGADFDVAAFLARCELEPLQVFKTGEARFAASQPNGPMRKKSGLNFLVSDADFSELALQMQDALAFVGEHEEFIASLRDFPGVEFVTMDFGAEIHSPFWCSFNFSSQFLLEIGKLGIELELSVYPVSDEEELTITTET